MTAYRFTDPKNRKLRIREQATPDAEVLEFMDSGTEFEAEEQGEWLKMPNGYVLAELCEVIEQAENDTVLEHSEESESQDNALESMTVQQLRQLAKDSGIKLKAGMNKEAIIEALLDE